MAYAADQIVVNGMELKQLERLEITNSPGEHGQLYVCGYLDESAGEAVLYGLKERDSISVYAGGNLIFSGIITKARVTGHLGIVKMDVQAGSRSILMDRRRKSRSFQDTSMTFGTLIRTILKDYPGSDFILSVKDRPIGEVAVQYRETDWVFIKRMLSILHAVLTCRIASGALQLYVGVPKLGKKGWNYQTTGYQKAFGTYDYWLQQGISVNDNDFFLTTVKTDDLPELFEEAEDHGRRLTVSQLSYSVVKGALSCSCSLQKREGILAPALYPMHLTGTALEGTILEVRGSKVRVHLKIDDENDQEECYWFPFSTLSASPDGSGWYYMPETGDQVRVYFPSKYTKDAIAVSAVSNYENKDAGKPDRMGNPSSKYLSNPGGQQMKLAEDGISLSCRGGAASVKLGNDGALTIYAGHTIEITAENNLNIEAEEAVSIQASEAALFSCMKGGAVQMQEDGNLYIQGTEVKLD